MYSWLQSKEYFALFVVLSVAQMKLVQLWDRNRIPPQRAAHTLPPLYFLLLCVCGCARVLWTRVKWVAECQQCASACPTERLNALQNMAGDCVRAVRLAVDRCVFLLTAVINGEHPWLGTKLLLNSLTFCVIATGQFAEEVWGSNGIRLQKYNYHFTNKWKYFWAAWKLEMRCMHMQCVHLHASTPLCVQKMMCVKKKTYEWLFFSPVFLLGLSWWLAMAPAEMACQGSWKCRCADNDMLKALNHQLVTCW